MLAWHSQLPGYRGLFKQRHAEGGHKGATCHGRMGASRSESIIGECGKIAGGQRRLLAGRHILGTAAISAPEVLRWCLIICRQEWGRASLCQAGGACKHSAADTDHSRPAGRQGAAAPCTTAQPRLLARASNCEADSPSTNSRRSARHRGVSGAAEACVSSRSAIRAVTSRAQTAFPVPATCPDSHPAETCCYVSTQLATHQSCPLQFPPGTQLTGPAGRPDGGNLVGAHVLARLLLGGAVQGAQLLQALLVAVVAAAAGSRAGTAGLSASRGADAAGSRTAGMAGSSPWDP